MRWATPTSGSRLICQALRKLAGTLNRTKTICIFTNQLRERIGVMFGNPEATPGSRALKFCVSVRLDIRRTNGTGRDASRVFAMQKVDGLTWV